MNSFRYLRIKMALFLPGHVVMKPEHGLDASTKEKLVSKIIVVGIIP